MLPAGTKKEQAMKLAEQGLNAGEISRKIDVKYSTVYSWLNPEKCKKKKATPKQEKHSPGWNADRHACRSCIYRMTGAMHAKGANCDYTDKMDRTRGCSVEDCDKYVKGAPIKKARGHDAEWMRNEKPV